MPAPIHALRPRLPRRSRSASPLLLALALLVPSVAAHEFFPSQAAGIDVFLDQGPALLHINGEPCHAEMIFESLSPQLLSPGAVKTNQPSFFLKVFGKAAGLGTLTVTVNDGFFFANGEKHPCGEGGTVYSFPVRVWPSKKDYEKKLKQALVSIISGLKVHNAQQVKLLTEIAQEQLTDFLLGQVFGDTNLPKAFCIQTVFRTAEGWNRAHIELQKLLKQAMEQGGELLVQCGFALPFVQDAGFLPTSAGSPPSHMIALNSGVLSKLTSAGAARIEKAAKGPLEKLSSATAKGGAPADVNLVFANSDEIIDAIFGDAPVLGLPKGSDPGPPSGLSFGPFLTVLGSADVMGGEPLLVVTGVAEPGALLTVTVRDGDGLLHTDAAVLVDEDGSFATLFEQDLPRGHAVEVLVSDPITAVSDSAVIHVANFANN